MPVCLEALLFLCPFVLRVSGSLRRQPLCFFGHADVSPWPAAQRPFVYLMNTYVAYVFRAKRLIQALYLLFLCPYVLMFSALADNYKHMPVRGKCSVSLFVNCEICR